MAAPADKTLKDMSGEWIMNKKLSDDTDYILQLQGIGWFLRKAISLATVYLTINEYIDDNSLTHIDIKQVATGGVGGNTENRTLDWTPRDHKDGIFGEVKAKSRWIDMKDVDDDDFLKTGFDDMEGDHIQAWAESKNNGWTANQIWGFEVIDEKRYHTRRVVVRKGDDWKLARLVYDYQGSGKSEEKAANREEDDLAYGE